MYRILYITYDGLLDPLGSSQILPYVKSFTMWHAYVVILSFEKPERLTTNSCTDLRERLGHMGIQWEALSFTRSGGALGKVSDMVRMYFWAVRLAIRHQVSSVHGRGQLASQVGIFVKHLCGTRLLFDCRGLWADERIDKGGWDTRRILQRLQYRYFKRAERELLSRADHVVALTEAVVPELCKLAPVSPDRITVIPCCADFDLFRLTDQDRRSWARASLGLPRDALVLGYLGSVGRMYMLDRFLRLCEMALRSDPSAHVLVLSPDQAALRTLMNNHLPSDLHNRVRCQSATRQQVADLIPAMDILVSFIQPSYARIASSPTKVAECFAEGIPTICNAGVGDLSEQIRALDGGLVLEDTSDLSLRETVLKLEQIKNKGGLRLRNEARKIFGLEVATARYHEIYRKIHESPAC
jgi:glycosyltransferase involved in cell wall biosynthesis